MAFEFVRIAANGRHEYRCQTCGNGFWFAVRTELDDDLQPRWSGCPHCAGWRLPLPHEEDPMADGDDVVASAPEKSWKPTNKWIAAELAAIGTFLVALIQNEWQLSSELQVVLVGLVVQAVTTYLLKNSDTPGGVPIK